MRRRAALALVAALAVGCGAGSPAAPARDGLVETALPDLAGLSPFAQAQVQTRQDALAAALAAPDTSDAALAQAFGAVGQVLMAGDRLAAAVPYLENAMTLAPADGRWPYYLGQAARLTGDPAGAAAYFETARARGEDGLATRVWLGVVAAAAGRPADAVDAYTDALALDPAAAPALIALAEIALADGDTEAAIARLDAALAADPTATAAHGVLADAYTARGDGALAAAHAAQAGSGVGRLPDPLMDELLGLLETAQAYETRAYAAVEQGDWRTAAEEFQRAAALAPEDWSLQFNLGTALTNAGDGPGARQAFLAAERLDPENAGPQFALGVLYQMAGRYREAIERFDLAATYDPTMTTARLGLADTLRQAGRPAAALPVYVQLLDETPVFADAQFGLAVALIQLERWPDALEVLTSGIATYPQDPRFAHGTARLLSAAPDASVRDGVAALQIMRALIQVQPDSIEVSETMAMTMAENEIWVDAIDWQQDTIDGAHFLGLEPEHIAWLEANLARYERHEPLRRPWREGHAVFQPGGTPQPDLLP